MGVNSIPQNKMLTKRNEEMKNYMAYADDGTELMLLPSSKANAQFAANEHNYATGDVTYVEEVKD